MNGKEISAPCANGLMIIRYEKREMEGWATVYDPCPDFGRSHTPMVNLSLAELSEIPLSSWHIFKGFVCYYGYDEADKCFNELMRIGVINTDHQ